MNTFRKEIKGTDGSVQDVLINSVDKIDVMIGSNYKLVKICNQNKKSFKDSILGTDIGIHSNGFANVTIISLVLAIGALLLMYFQFRI